MINNLACSGMNMDPEIYLGRRRDPFRIEGRTPDQDLQERRAWPVFKLYRDHTPVCARESVEQSHLGKDERAGRSSPPGSARRLHARQVMYRPDHNTANYSGIIN